MESEHFVAKIALKAIIEKDRKVLIARPPLNGEVVWELPGGRLNKGELLEEGLRREIKEELGIEIELKDTVAADTFHNVEAGGDHLTLVYHAVLKNGDNPFILQKSEIAEVKWITASQLHEQKIWADNLNALEIFFKQK